MKLSEADDNDKLEIVDVVGDKTYHQRLNVLGMFEGCQICPLRHNKSTVLVDVDGCRYAMSKELADCILVKRL